MSPFIRLAVEAGPLAVFFVTNAQAGLMTGTAAFMVAVSVSLAISWRLEKKLPIMPLVGCFFVLLFGGLTLWLNDEIFIKLKPTLVNLLFAAALFTAHFMRRNLLKRLLGAVMSLTEEGWRALALRWAFFFLALAAANEIVWRSFSTDAWVNFKVFVILPATVVFSALQTPLILRHQIAEDSEKRPEEAAP